MWRFKELTRVTDRPVQKDSIDVLNFATINTNREIFAGLVEKTQRGVLAPGVVRFSGQIFREHFWQHFPNPVEDPRLALATGRTEFEMLVLVRIRDWIVTRKTPDQI